MKSEVQGLLDRAGILFVKGRLTCFLDSLQWEGSSTEEMG